MNSVAGSHAAPTGAATQPVNMQVSAQVSLFRLYTLRVSYLILAAGLGVYIWPDVIHHTSDLAISSGIQISLLAGIGTTAVLGLRYPVQMVPLLLFELIWKTIYLVGFALPRYGISGVFLAFSTFAIIGCIAATFMIETQRRVLEEVSP